MKKPIVFLSKYNWKPGIKGSEIAFSIGDKAIFRAKSGIPYDVIVRSDLMSHADAPNGQFVRELEFFDSPDHRHETVAVNADQMEPIL
jgi:hypothetical protein